MRRGGGPSSPLPPACSSVAGPESLPPPAAPPPPPLPRRFGLRSAGAPSPPAPPLPPAARLRRRLSPASALRARMAGYVLRERAGAPRVYTGVSGEHGGMHLVAHDAIPAGVRAVTAEVAQVVCAREWERARGARAAYAVPAPRGWYAVLAEPTPEHLLNLVDAAARGERANLRLAVPRPLRAGALVAGVAVRGVRAGEILRLPCGYGDRRHAGKIHAEALAAARPRPAGCRARARCAGCGASLPLAKIGRHATLCARGVQRAAAARAAHDSGLRG
jgi:hypothetical protein